MAEGGGEGIQPAALGLCEECGESFKSTQGLAGHRRLRHGVADTESLREREADLTEREARLDRSGPADLGMVRCPECGSWSESAFNLRRHRLTLHPIENAVAGEVGVSPERVSSVWVEACRKQERHPNEEPDQILRRFWDGTDRRILSRLLARNAVFRFAKAGD